MHASKRQVSGLSPRRSAAPKRIFATVACLTLLGTLLSVCCGPVETQSAQQSSGLNFRPLRVVKEFPAIKDVPVLSADEVDGQVRDSELVLGVVVGGEARAYPINMLTSPRREIINDNLGGRPIAATW